MVPARAQSTLTMSPGAHALEERTWASWMHHSLPRGDDTGAFVRVWAVSWINEQERQIAAPNA
jgi:hypothetical protein